MIFPLLSISTTATQFTKATTLPLKETNSKVPSPAYLVFSSLILCDLLSTEQPEGSSNMKPSSPHQDDHWSSKGDKGVSKAKLSRWPLQCPPSLISLPRHPFIRATFPVVISEAKSLEGEATCLKLNFWLAWPWVSLQTGRTEQLRNCIKHNGSQVSIRERSY